jgi:hypothetical protein
MAYTPPTKNAVNFVLTSQTPPSKTAVNFEFGSAASRIGYLKVYMGAGPGWVWKPIKIYMGASLGWVIKPLKYRTAGASWQVTNPANNP